jgi:hypothetical protein
MNPFQKRVLRPWDGCAHGVVSLLEMLRFFANEYILSAMNLGSIESVAAGEDRDGLAKPEALGYVFAHIQILNTLASYHGLAATSSQCERIIRRIDGSLPQVRWKELREMLKSLRERGEDELRSEFFLHLDKREVEMYDHPTKDWEEVSSRFHKIRFNIEEAMKCFALQRYGAAVFHILQVAEYGVIKVAELMQVPDDKPGWGSLQKIQNLIKIPYPQRTDLAQTHSKFLESVLPLAFVIKDRWRHKLDHVNNQIVWYDTDFSPELADEIIKATRGFMRNLAKELPR